MKQNNILKLLKKMKQKVERMESLIRGDSQFPLQRKREIMNNIVTRTDFLRHSITENGDRKNYDCIGVAVIAAKIIGQHLGAQLYSKKNVENENSTMRKIGTDLSTPVTNSLYNMFGMWNLLNFSDEIQGETIEAGDWIIWQKHENKSHGHVVTVVEYSNKLTVLSGTTNGFPRIDVYENLSEIIEKYDKIYPKNAFSIRRPNWRPIQVSSDMTNLLNG